MCGGRAVLVGNCVVIAPIKVFKSLNIRIRKTLPEHTVCIDNTYKPLYEKADWNQCDKLSNLLANFESHLLNDCLVINPDDPAANSITYWG